MEAFVYVCLYVPWVAGMMHQGGGVGIPAIREESWYAHVQIQPIPYIPTCWCTWPCMCVQVQRQMHKCVQWLCTEPLCKHIAHSVCVSLINVISFFPLVFHYHVYATCNDK